MYLLNISNTEIKTTGLGKLDMSGEGGRRGKWEGEKGRKGKDILVMGKMGKGEREEGKN